MIRDGQIIYVNEMRTKLIPMSRMIKCAQIFANKNAYN